MNTKKFHRIFFIGVLISSLPLTAFWQIESVDTSGNVGDNCSIAVDMFGYPHISYKDGTSGWKLKYAHWDGVQWQFEYVENTQDVYGVTSITLDSLNYPHIAFGKSFLYGGQLWHTWWDGSNWQQEGVDSFPNNGDVGEWNSIKFGTDGYLHIAYTLSDYSTGNYYLKYAYEDELGWHTEVVDSVIGDEIKYVSLALDENNNPHISYYDWSTEDLKYACLVEGRVDTQWSRVYGGSSGDWIYGIEAMDGGGYIICGYTYSFGSGNQDLWVLRIDDNGDTLWSYTYGGWGNDRTYDDLEKTDDGGYIINGTTHSFSPDGTHAMWLVKLDSTGQIEWDRSFSTGQPYDYGESGEAIQTFDGGYIIAGSSFSSGHATSVGFVVKTDSVGGEVWRKTFCVPDSETQFFDLVQTQDSGYMILGQTNGYGSGNNDLLIFKIDSIGDSLWAKIYGGTENDAGRIILPTDDGNYLIVGNTQSFAQYSSAIWFLKINPDGDTLWTKVYDYWYAASVNDMENTSDSNYIIVGSCRPDSSDSALVLLIKITGSGDILWMKHFGVDSVQVWGSSIVQTIDKGYITVGGKRKFGSIESDGYLLKVSCISPFWQIEKVDTAGNVGLNSTLSVDTLNHPHIAYWDGSNSILKYAQWDGMDWKTEVIDSPEVVNPKTVSMALYEKVIPHIVYVGDWNIVKYGNLDGSNWNIEVVDSNVTCEWLSLEIDKDGISQIAYYDGGDSTNLKYARGTPSGIGQKFSEEDSPDKFWIYPNPFRNLVTIKYTLRSPQKVDLKVYSITGRLVKNIIDNKTQGAGIHRSYWNGVNNNGKRLRNGVYFLYLQRGDMKNIRKLILLK